MMHVTPYPAAFKAKVLQDFLLSMPVTEEFCAIYGVPVVEIRRWIREAVGQMDTVFAARRSGECRNNDTQESAQKPTDSQPLSARELDALLGDYEDSDANG